jgi:hypothetical protein
VSEEHFHLLSLAPELLVGRRCCDALCFLPRCFIDAAQSCETACSGSSDLSWSKSHILTPRNIRGVRHLLTDQDGLRISKELTPFLAVLGAKSGLLVATEREVDA